MEAAATSEDSKHIFLALGQYFGARGQLDLFATQVLSSLRGDLRPQLGYRIDNLLDLLARVPGACGALARLVPGTGKAADRECSFSENPRKHIETTAPAREEEESKRRGSLMLNQPMRPSSGRRDAHSRLTPESPDGGGSRRVEFLDRVRRALPQHPEGKGSCAGICPVRSG
jgi:hypothetical protein